jgi:hypothetical protein
MLMTDADIERHVEAMLTGQTSHLHSSAVALAIAYRQLRVSEAILEATKAKNSPSRDSLEMPGDRISTAIRIKNALGNYETSSVIHRRDLAGVGEPYRSAIIEAMGISAKTSLQPMDT